MMLPLLVHRIIGNKHTSIAAVVYFCAKFGVGVGAIWLPQYKDQFEQTANYIEGAAVSYGLIMAGDAKPVTKQDQPANNPAATPPSKNP